MPIAARTHPRPGPDLCGRARRRSAIRWQRRVSAATVIPGASNWSNASWTRFEARSMSGTEQGYIGQPGRLCAAAMSALLAQEPMHRFRQGWSYRVQFPVGLDPTHPHV